MDGTSWKIIAFSDPSLQSSGECHQMASCGTLNARYERKNCFRRWEGIRRGIVPQLASEYCPVSYRHWNTVNASILRVCNAVNVVSINSSVLDKSFWNVFRNNPNLRELRIRDCYFGIIPTEQLPANSRKGNTMVDFSVSWSQLALFEYIRRLTRYPRNQ